MLTIHSLSLTVHLSSWNIYFISSCPIDIATEMPRFLDLPNETLTIILQHHFISLNVSLRIRKEKCTHISPRSIQLTWESIAIKPGHQTFLAVILTCKRLYSLALPIFYNSTVFKHAGNGLESLHYPLNYPPYTRIQCISGRERFLDEILDVWAHRKPLFPPNEPHFFTDLRTNDEKIFPALKRYIMKTHVNIDPQHSKLLITIKC